MTSEAKLAMVKAILRIDSSDTSEDALITTYLDMAAQEILSWRYSNANPDNVPEAVPTEYEMTQVQAVINGYTQSGVEGQVLSIENGVHRHFQYADMVEYVRAHVIPIAGVIRSTNTSCPCSCDSSTPNTEDGTEDSQGNAEDNDGTQTDGGEGG